MLKQARPPVFFKRQRALQAQLRAWSLSDLVTAGSTLSANVLAARQNAELAQAIAGRCLLSRIIYGARISLTIGIFGVIISFVLGIIIAVLGVSGSILVRSGPSSRLTCRASTGVVACAQSSIGTETKVGPQGGCIAT